MKLWTPLLGEWLFGKKESSNRVDKNAVVLIRLNSCGKEEVVSHFPQNISKVVSFYLSVTLLSGTWSHWKRVNRGGSYGLEIPARFRFYGPKTTAWVVGNETNKNQRTIKKEPKLLPQIKYNFLAEE